MNTESRYVWHYTVGTPLAAIARSGRLRPAMAHGRPARPGEHDILWFSRNQQWDPSATQDDGLSEARHALSRAALHARFGLYRFGIAANDSRLLPWPTVTRVADIEVPDAMAMVAAGLRCGAAPTDWIGTLTEIPLSELRFEAWTGREWTTADLNELAAQLA
ncbi:hypothetical protein SAMN05216321_10996 [Cupriavidus sp. OV038]|uniref:hypothetical protein n=1 Tax=unclassified Cupriavidus TaxID=2640874 RepID=UPI0008E202F7|nr:MULTISPECIES: hypothetical protein [unclassified Cupriavidus]SFC98071.1 hypothetical protein SAMN05216321_10996 [Cupriavidus sp. OV038]SFP63420.1 hypothetical protein SAMN05216322_108106 [Cupriavidus sp. OV096]